jgi:hypothetical protein
VPTPQLAKAASTVPLYFLFNLPNPSDRTMTLVFTQLPTEMINGNLPGDKGRSERNSDNFIAIYEKIF